MSYVFNKLFSSITESTVWGESHATRIVWITMLARADRHGQVLSSIPGLAHISRVTLEECEAALECFSSPDPYSRTSEFDGRRIKAIDGGWQLLNYTKYRDLQNQESIRESKRKWAEKHRKNKKNEEKVEQKVEVSRKNRHQSIQAEAEAEAEAVKPKGLTHSRKAASACAHDPSFDEFWRAYPKRRAKGQALKTWKRIKPSRATLDAMLAAIARQRASPGWTKDGGQYIPYPATWLNQIGWEDEPDEPNPGHCTGEEDLGF